MSYRPISDMWILTRCKYKGKVKRYGGYLGGFPERARALLGCNINDPVLHVCGGLARLYPYKRGFGPNDKTLDLDPAVEPDFLADASEPLPFYKETPDDVNRYWGGVLIDPPYSEVDAAYYPPGSDRYPKPNLLIKNALDVVAPGGRCGLIHYILPSPPKDAIFVAAVGILSGYNNRIRIFSVFENAA